MKDLSRVVKRHRRHPLSHIILLDDKEVSGVLQPRNLMLVTPWTTLSQVCTLLVLVRWPSWPPGFPH